MQLGNGMDDRRNAWIFTCSRWSESDTYIVLPINPTSFEVSNPIRGSQGETQRGKFMYVHRNPISKSVIAPCNYSFEIPSGLILPQFNSTYIKEAQRLVGDFSASMHASRTAASADSIGNTVAAQAGVTSGASDQRQNITERKIASYKASIQNYTSHLPSAEQTLDYRSRNAGGQPGVSIAFPSSSVSDRNIPNLYLPDVPIGIQNFYAFIMLMDEPRTYVDKYGKSRNNNIVIHFNSLELPAMTFWGWWDQGGISFSEDVEDHGQFNINFSIFVTASNPSFGYNGFSAMINNYKAEIASTSTSLSRLKQILAR